MAHDLGDMERICRSIGGAIGDALEAEGGRRLGFALLLFDFGGDGHMTYMSNAQRTEMVTALRECADTIEGRRDKTPQHMS